MNIIVIELIVVLGVALGLGFWQLYDVNRELRKDKNKDKDEQRDGAHRDDRKSPADKSD